MEREVYGDAVERQREVNEEALRRARVRKSHDMNSYSEAEHAPALPVPDTAMNWNAGEVTMTPSGVHGSHPTGLQSAPRVDSGLSGVDAICGFGEGGR